MQEQDSSRYDGIDEGTGLEGCIILLPWAMWRTALDTFELEFLSTRREMVRCIVVVRCHDAFGKGRRWLTLRALNYTSGHLSRGPARQKPGDEGAGNLAGLWSTPFAVRKVWC